MPLYVALYQLTDKGIKNVKDAPERYQNGLKLAESMGIKSLGFWVTMGEYDYVSVGEAPDDETMLKFLLKLNSSGFVSTTTMKAFTSDQLAELVKDM